MSYQNFKQAIAINKAGQQRLKKICPTLNNDSGIYVFYRHEICTYAYIGQAVDIGRRCANHLTEYDHIANSLKSRGLYSEENKGGWKLSFFNCPKDKLDEKERESIQTAIDKGYVLYNVTAGGQNIGKHDINERKANKGYQDGLKQGYLNCKKEMLNYFTKYLDFSIKKNTNKIKERKFQQFKEWLNNDK